MMKHSTQPSLAFFALSSLRETLAIAVALALALSSQAAKAQDARSIVAAAVKNELAADREDHTAFMYRDRDVTPDHDTLFYVVETTQGQLKKKLEDHGHALSPDERRADDQRIQALLNDPSAQQRARKDSSHDDDQAEQMLRLLPQAYLWTITAENGNLVTLSFVPDPNFSAPNLEARVLSAMGGQITVARSENRIASIKGTLLNDVTFGFGLFGRLHKGGSFEVIRKEVVPGHWQMTESRVHINGRALFFKTIGSQEDEYRSDFRISNVKSLREANDILNQVH